MSEIPAVARAIATNRIQIELEERRDVFAKQIQNIYERMSARGMLQSGMTVVEVRDAIRQEAQVRLFLAWGILSRILAGEALPVDSGLVAESKEVVRSGFDGAKNDLRTHYDRLKTIGLGTVEPFEDLFSPAFKKIDSEIDIALRSAAVQPSSGATTVNIYQPYGIVQTGGNSTATFTATVTENRQTLVNALTEVEKAIGSSRELPDDQKNEAQDLIRETRRELDGSKPNSLRVRAALGALGSVVQTLGSAAPAYKLLKAAASLFGVTLP